MTVVEDMNWYSDESATFGDRLSVAREAQGMTQKTFAKRVGVAVKTVEGWENDTSEPRANRLQMAAGILNVSMKWLLTGEGDGPDLEDPQEEGEDMHALLLEMRQLRTEMAQSSERLGKIEKRLKSAMAVV